MEAGVYKRPGSKSTARCKLCKKHIKCPVHVDHDLSGGRSALEGPVHGVLSTLEALKCLVCVARGLPRSHYGHGGVGTWLIKRWCLRWFWRDDADRRSGAV
jgi:hypothetical protein